MRFATVVLVTVSTVFPIVALAADDFGRIPSGIRAQIKAKCIAEYPGDYTTQYGCILGESRSYLEVHGGDAPASSRMATKKPASEPTWCHAKEPTARILASANPNDLDADWTGENYVGTGAGLNPSRRFKKNGVEYIEGKLVSTRGGVLEKHMFALASEWDCDR